MIDLNKVQPIRTGFDLTAKDPNAPVTKPSVYDQVQAVMSENILFDTMREHGRQKDISTARTTGTPLEMDEEAIKEINSQYTKKEAESMMKSKTKEEYLIRQRQIGEDRKHQQTFEEMGVLKSSVLLLAGQIIDPSTYVSGGASLAFKGSRAMKALQTGAVVATENMAIESVLVKHDTSADDVDIAIAGIAGFSIGGGLSLALRKGDAVRAKLADDADTAIKADADAYDVNDTIKTMHKDGEVKTELDYTLHPDVDRIQVEADLKSVEASTNAQIKSKLTTKEIDDALNELADIETKRTQISDDFNTGPNEARNITGLTEEGANVELRKLDARARELENRLGSHEKGVQAEDFKKKWRSYSQRKRIRKLYDNGRPIPNRRKAGESQKARVEEQAIEEAKGSKLEADIREQRLAELESDPDFQKRYKEYQSKVEGVKAKAKEDIESKYDCTL